MLSEKYNMDSTEAVYSEFHELLGDLRVIWEETKYRIDKEDYEDISERERLQGMFRILDRHIFSMAEELEEFSE